jgi:AcrR family transcriptional regulator
MAASVARPAVSDVRERILELFSRRAKREGIRAVGMGELARELRMSASTLYKHYRSKEALTLACVERWALDVAAFEAAEPDPGHGRDSFERFMHWVDAWADANASLSPAFLHDLRSDYPQAFERYREVIRERQLRGAQLLRPALRPDVDERVAFAILKMLLDQTMDAQFAERLRISRQEAMRSAVAIWAAGAMQRRGELRSLRPDARQGTNESEEKAR